MSSKIRVSNIHRKKLFYICALSPSFSIVYHYEYLPKKHNGFLLMSFKYPLGQWIWHYPRLCFKRDFVHLIRNWENVYVSFSSWSSCSTYFQWLHSLLHFNFPIFWPWNTNYISFYLFFYKRYATFKFEFGLQVTERTVWNVIESFSCKRNITVFRVIHILHSKFMESLNEPHALKKLFILRYQNSS